MAQAFHADYGFPLGVEMVERLIRALDEGFLLDNEHSAAALAEARPANPVPPPFAPLP